MPDVSAKPDFAEAKQRLEAWWAGSSLGRPAVVARVPKPDAPPETPDDRPRADREMDPQWHVRKFAHILDAIDFRGEAMPAVYPYLGDNLVMPAILVGAELDYRPDTTWIMPMADVYERDLPAFTPDAAAFRAVEAIVRAQADALGRRGLLSAPPILDGLTTLSMLREPEPLLMDMIDRPADVRRAAAQLDEIALAAHAAMFAVLTELGHPQTVTWADIYAPGKAEMVQCDVAIMLSPAMFDEFAMPYLRRVTEYFDYSCYHLDGTPQTRFLDQLCSLPRLHAIQWNPEPPAAPPMAWVDFFGAVRARGRSLWIACDAETALGLTRALGPDGLLLSIKDLDSADQAEALIRRLAAFC